MQRRISLLHVISLFNEIPGVFGWLTPSDTFTPSSLLAKEHRLMALPTEVVTLSLDERPASMRARSVAALEPGASVPRTSARKRSKRPSLCRVDCSGGATLSSELKAAAQQPHSRGAERRTCNALRGLSRVTVCCSGCGGGRIFE